MAPYSFSLLSAETLRSLFVPDFVWSRAFALSQYLFSVALTLDLTAGMAVECTRLSGHSGHSKVIHNAQPYENRVSPSPFVFDFGLWDFGLGLDNQTYLVWSKTLLSVFFQIKV